MAQKQLVRNVFVGDVWYGPAHPENVVTADVLERIDNPAVFEEVGPADDGIFGPLPGSPIGVGAGAGPVSRAEADKLAELNKDDLLALAEARGVDVPKSASKADIIERLTAGTRD